MPGRRIAATAFSLLCLSLALSVAAAGSANAQSAAPGQPIQLLPKLSHAEKTRPGKKIHAGRISRRLRRRHFAARRKLQHVKRTAKLESAAKVETAKAQAAKVETAKAETAIPEAARSALPPNIWPGLGTAAPSEAAAAPPPAQTASQLSEPTPSELVVGGRTVQVVSPNRVNAIDLAADAADTAHTVSTAVAAQARKDGSPIGSGSWIAQVLAARGGAVAAGAVAWFLIGSTPQRMYG